MRAHVLQHVPFEEIGSMALWLAQFILRKARHVKTRRFK
jgi:hypothetical protein